MTVSRRLDQIEQTALRVRPIDVGKWAVATGQPSVVDAILVAPADLGWLLALVRSTRIEPSSVGRCGHEAPLLVTGQVGTGTPVYCRLPHGHPGWHRGDDNSEWNERATSPASGGSDG